MTEPPIAGTTLRFGGRTARENLDRAVAGGKLTARDDGRFVVPVSARNWYLPVKHALNLDCHFLNNFVFAHAYDRKAVPAGCRACFKVKVAPADFRGLIALRGILEDLPYHSKCGVDLFNPHSRDFYAGYFYFVGLAGARQAWGVIRERVDAHPQLGPGTAMSIKRGCSNYEAHCGPSDAWTFAEGLEEIEAGLRPSFEPPAVAPLNYSLLRATKMAEWLQVAFNLRDDTYLDFTRGKPLHPPTRSYPPTETPSSL